MIMKNERTGSENIHTELLKHEGDFLRGDGLGLEWKTAHPSK